MIVFKLPRPRESNRPDWTCSRLLSRLLTVSAVVFAANLSFGCMHGEEADRKSKHALYYMMSDRLIQLQLGLMHGEEWEYPGLVCGDVPFVNIVRIEYPVSNNQEFVPIYNFAKDHNINLFNSDKASFSSCMAVD